MDYSPELNNRLDEITEPIEDDAVTYGGLRKNLNSFIAGVRKGIETGYINGYDGQELDLRTCPKRRSPDFRRGWRYGYEAAYNIGSADLDKENGRIDEMRDGIIRDGRDLCVHEVQRRVCGECSHSH